MLELKDVTINYKKKNILQDVNIHASEGEIIGFLGANGSGKSTLLSVIAGVKKVEKGTIKLNDIILGNTPDEYRKHIGYVPQENPLIMEISAIDNLRIWSEKSKEDMLKEISNEPLSILGVSGFANKKVSSLSGGMKKRLSITATLITKPDVLLMDEPLAALDMVAKHDIMEYILAFKEKGGTILIVSHEEMVLNFCDRIYFLNEGRVNEVDKNSGLSYIEMLRGKANVLQ